MNWAFVRLQIVTFIITYDKYLIDYAVIQSVIILSIKIPFKSFSITHNDNSNPEKILV